MFSTLVSLLARAIRAAYHEGWHDARGNKQEARRWEQLKVDAIKEFTTAAEAATLEE